MQEPQDARFAARQLRALVGRGGQGRRNRRDAIAIKRAGRRQPYPLGSRSNSGNPSSSSS